MMNVMIIPYQVNNCSRIHNGVMAKGRAFYVGFECSIEHYGVVKFQDKLPF